MCVCNLKESKKIVVGRRDLMNFWGAENGEIE